MTGFDYTVIVILASSLAVGVWRGLTYELLSLAGWVVALMVSKLFAPGIVTLMPFDHATVRVAAAYVVLFIATLILWRVLVWMSSKLVKASGLGGLDRTMGGLFGLVRGLLAILVLVWLGGLTSMPEQPFWRNAQTSRAAEDVALLTRGWLPVGVAQHIRYGARG